MVNEQKNIQEVEFEEIGRLIGGLKRVEAPKDFDFHVRARIAKGRPVERTRSWLPASVRYAAPLVLVLAIGGYVGFRTTYSTDQAAVPVVVTAPVETASQPVVPVVDPVAPRGVVEELPFSQTVAEVKPSETGNKATKTIQKAPLTANSKNEKPGGGSYDTASREPDTIRQPDIDDNEPAPAKKVIVPVSQFLSSVGVNAAGGKIVSVGGAAASAGLKAGDVIQGVNVQAGTIRVSRDGKTITVTIK